MLLISGLCGVSTVWGAAKPNIIYIMSDDAAYSDFGFSAALNNTPATSETPNLDALAQQSVVASQAYVAHSLCHPTRVGLLTGQYQQRYGMEENITSDTNSLQGLVPEQTTIAQRLKPLGYTTGMIGKWHLGYIDGVNRPLDKGFDEFYGLLGGGRDFFLDNSAYGRMWKNNQVYESQYRQEGDPSKYDPVKGRYVTDAWGEEAVNFIDQHAADENPFFLYLSFTSPHAPHQGKQADLDHFASITNPTRQAVAAQTYAMDRSIGEVLDSLAANGIDDNTIVVFTNDNGATSDLGNAPFKGHKGTTWEGGIRMPFLIKGPGLQPGVYDSPISFYDMLPTFVTAAGGDVSQFAHDGYDVMPYLKGDAVDDPNRLMFWRSLDKWAVRKGDWKLEAPYTNSFFLHNIAEDPDENYYQNYYTHPEIVADLLRELTHWEAQMAKPKWGALGIENQNLFDHFVFRTDQGNTANWSTASVWEQAGTTSIATLKPGDAYPNAIIEFGIRNDDDYVATNDMTRSTRRTFMLNQLQLTGNLTSVADRQATINGNSILFVRSLDGELPSIRLDATSGSSAKFTFQINNEIQLLHDLDITGNGTQNFVINGPIRDYYEAHQPEVFEAHSVRKLGSSSVTLSGANTFTGKLTVEQGSVTLDGPSAAINGAQGIDIKSAGMFTLQSGTVAVNWINNANGGFFQFNGGLLKVVNFQGNLVNLGGTFSPGASPAVSKISGNVSQQVGTTVIEIGGTAVGSQYDSLVVGGSAHVGSTLDVDLLNSYSPTAGRAFQIITAEGGVSGTFAETLLPTLSGGLFWNVLYGANSVILAVAPTSSLVTIPGDFNQNGTVDAADYTVWRNNLGTTFAAADADFDGQVTEADYGIWKSNFGFSLVGSGFASIALRASVPEPATAALLSLGIVGALGLTRSRSKRAIHHFVER
jgi:autotransporter-associated beta strand protein